MKTVPPQVDPLPRKARREDISPIGGSSPKKEIKSPTDRAALERRLIKKIIPQQVDPQPIRKEKLLRKTDLLQEEPLPKKK